MQTNLKQISEELKERQEKFSQVLHEELKPEYYEKIQKSFQGLLGKQIAGKTLLEVPKGAPIVVVRSEELSILTNKFNGIIKSFTQIHGVFKAQYDFDHLQYIRNKDMKVSIDRSPAGISGDLMSDLMSDLILEKFPEMTKKLEEFKDKIQNIPMSGGDVDVRIPRRFPGGKVGIGLAIGAGVAAAAGAIAFFRPEISKGLTQAKNKVVDIGVSVANVPSMVVRESQNQASNFAQGYNSSSTPAGKPTGTTSRHMEVLYGAFREQGMTHEGAKTMIAQIGRENSFQERYLFGTHIDPANNAVNAGMISWQGDRGKKLLEFMRGKGMLDSEGKIVKSDASLKAQAQFMMHELKTVPEYRKSLNVLTQEGLTYDQIEHVVGDNYIRWRRTDPKYSAAGYRNQNQFYSQATAVVEGGKSNNLATSAGSVTGAVVSKAATFFDDIQGAGGDLLQYIRLSSSNINLGGLHPAMKRRFSAMAAEYHSITGKKIQVNSAFRTYEQQAALFKEYGPGRTARPGRSRHESGLAIDIQSVDGNRLVAMGLLQKYGFHRPVRGEPWHIEPVEGRNLKSEPDNPYAPGQPIIHADNKKGSKFINTASQDIAIANSKPKKVAAAAPKAKGAASTLTMNYDQPKKKGPATSSSLQYSSYFS